MVSPARDIPAFDVRQLCLYAWLQQLGRVATGQTMVTENTTGGGTL